MVEHKRDENPIRQIESVEELDSLLGELTQEEKDLINSLDLSTKPTAEESAFLGPDFTERLIKKTLDKIQKTDYPQ